MKQEPADELIVIMQADFQDEYGSSAVSVQEVRYLIHLAAHRRTGFVAVQMRPSQAKVMKYVIQTRR